jgi:hypothetical protein
MAPLARRAEPRLTPENAGGLFVIPFSCMRWPVWRASLRERKWLSLDPLVTAELRAWVALRGKNPGPLFLQLGKGGRVLAGRRLSGDGVHKILETVGAKLEGIIRPRA